MIWLPTLEQVVVLHEKLITRTGGLAGVRDSGLIESAILRASAGYGGRELYAAVPEKAAAVCCGLIGNHGFIDGNKRAGIACMLLILKLNGANIRYTQAELIELGLAAARGELSVEAVAAWVNDRIV